VAGRYTRAQYISLRGQKDTEVIYQPGPGLCNLWRMARITKKELATIKLIDALVEARQTLAYGDIGRTFAEFIEGAVHADVVHSGGAIGHWATTPKARAAKAGGQ
jgi:hypothetical protein